jgi:16S rRNA (guanine527-N7)-methyltransferase
MNGLEFDWGPLVAWAEEREVRLPPGALWKLDRFAVALYERNRTTNLTRVPQEQAVVRHFVDSLLLAPLLAEASNLLDVGCGPGFPAWPLACALPGLRVTALDGSGKPLSFLRDSPLPNLEVVQARIEDWDRREAYDVVTGRAVAPLAVQLEVSAPWCRIGGAVVPYRTGREAEHALCFPAWELGLKLERMVEEALPGDAGARLFPVFRKCKETSSRYPRRWAEIKARPLGT